MYTLGKGDENESEWKQNEPDGDDDGISCPLKPHNGDWRHDLPDRTARLPPGDVTARLPDDVTCVCDREQLIP